jgi:hypothetical protein
MNVLHSTTYLWKPLHNLYVFIFLAATYFLKNITTACILHDNINIFSCLELVNKFDDVFVIEQLKYLWLWQRLFSIQSRDLFRDICLFGPAKFKSIRLTKWTLPKIFFQVAKFRFPIFVYEYCAFPSFSLYLFHIRFGWVKIKFFFV